VSTKDSDHILSTPLLSVVSTDVLAPKDSEVGFPDIPFRLEPDQDNLVFESSKPPAKPVFKPIEGI